MYTIKVFSKKHKYIYPVKIDGLEKHGFWVQYLYFKSIFFLYDEKTFSISQSQINTVYMNEFGQNLSKSPNFF